MTVLMPIVVPPGMRGLSGPIRALIRATLAQEGARVGEIGVTFAGDAELRDLNRRWRGIDRATDVLSFPYPDAKDERRRGRRGMAVIATARPRISGDLVISLDRATEQARRYRVSLGRELARLVVHGTLHLVGHDHHRESERRVMRAAEARALRAGRDATRDLEARIGRPAARRSTPRRAS